MKIIRSLAGALLAATLATPLHAETGLFLVDDLARESGHAPVRAQAHELAAIYADLARVAGVDAKLVYSDDPDLNAFATIVGDEKVVIVQAGLLTAFEGDRDAVAATLGHELAHHKADHIRAGRRKQQNVRVLGAILGAVVGARIGREHGQLAGAVSGAAVGVGADLLALKFNRNQELEADRLAVAWMIQAGYNPQGMLRLQQQIGALSGQKRRAKMLSTHPTSAKRYAAAQKQIATLAAAPDLLARAPAPLVDATALVEAQTAIQDAEQQRIAQLLAPTSDAPPAAALEPIDGIVFADYAALGNQLLYAGDAGKTSLLRQHKLDPIRLQALDAGFGARMQQHPALAQRYTIDFFRASQGPLAPWGRDLADSFEHGRALQLEPPYPLATARALRTALDARGAPALDATQQAAAEAELLRPHGLSYYDYLIGHNWWSRKASVAALAGDGSVMQAYFGAPDADVTSAAESGVQIGDGVTLGDNVHIGSRALQTGKVPDDD